MTAANRSQAVRADIAHAPWLGVAEQEDQVVEALRGALCHPNLQGFDLRHLACVEVLISEAGFDSLHGLSPDIARKALAQCEAVLQDTRRPAIAEFLRTLQRRAQGHPVADSKGRQAATPAAHPRPSLSAGDLAALERLLAEGDAQLLDADVPRPDPALDQWDFSRSDFMPGRKFEVSEIDSDEFDALLASASASRGGAERRSAMHGRRVAA